MLAVAIFTIDIAVLSESPTVFDVLDVPMEVIALLGVFAFLSRMRVLGQDYWRVFMPALVAWDLTYNLILAWETDLALRALELRAEEGLWWVLAVGLALMTPVYAALLLYAYRSPAIWAGLSKTRLPKIPGVDSNAQYWMLAVQWALLVPIIIGLFLLDLGFVQSIVLAIVSGAATGLLVPPVLYVIARLRPLDFTTRCHLCELTEVHVVRLPKTMRQFLRGGWTCRRCGSDLDRHGSPIE